jgi:hypothetical protein
MAGEKRVIINCLTIFDASGFAWGADYPQDAAELADDHRQPAR